ncbi:hypothetical protein F5144DRAFT_596250 [Chaetomium tenue]|uniref:Uncharacterized protein n=1 Tax=Chaetomium tenue TaxID=1854479 RepID=A0ACB7NVA7_9PEZI|nr:hypothetical protein F5144DRAFT_596250 [Chaetomium globosum]
MGVPPQEGHTVSVFDYCYLARNHRRGRRGRDSRRECAKPTSTPAAEDQNTASDTIIRVPTRGVIDFDCGRISMNRQVVTLGTASWGFDVNCMMDYIGPGVDLAGMTAYTFGDCIRACAMFNKFARNNTCLGVFFSANLTTSLPMHNANCFLKSYLPQMSPERDLAAAASLGSSPQFMKRGEDEVEGDVNAEILD